MKILIIIAFRDFQDIEYLVLKKELEREGIKTETVSNKKGIAVGVFGETVEIKKTISEIDVSDYHGIVFVGGGGCLPHLNNEISYQIARDASKKDLLLAAICIAPVILAESGVLKNKKATVWSSLMDRFPVRALKKNGVEYQKKNVVQDGRTITANGPKSAFLFAHKIIEVLTRK